MNVNLERNSKTVTSRMRILGDFLEKISVQQGHANHRVSDPGSQPFPISGWQQVSHLGLEELDTLAARGFHWFPNQTSPCAEEKRHGGSICNCSLESS